MTNDPLFIEMFDESETHSAPGAVPAQSPLDRELFAFERSTGAAELWAAQLEARHFAEQLLGIDDLTKQVGATLYDIRPPASSIRPPIDTNTFEQQPLPIPDEVPCECKCERCRKDDHAHCLAEKRCARYEDATKAVIAGMVGELRGRLYPRGCNVPRALWQGLEESMTRFVTRATASRLERL